MKEEILKSLNNAQQAAVKNTDGPLLIVAGAGTGKTTVITKKILYLLSQPSIKADNILALTFTNKASEEIVERVEQELALGYYDLWIATFHSFAERILKAEGLEIGLPTDFKLLTEVGSYLLLRENLSKLNLDYYSPRGNPAKFLTALVSHFSRLKDENITPLEYLDYANNLSQDQDNKMSGASEKSRLLELASVYHSYQKLLLENSALDFGDLILYCLELFKKRPQVLKKYQTQFKYILVDEFQDTNWAQYQLVKMLAKPENNLTVVGDDNQSIYRFRGAAMSNILNFKKDYPRAQTVVLTENYRSSQNILDSAYDLIQNNNPRTLEATLKISKKLTAFNQPNGQIEVMAYGNANQEVGLVLAKIKELKQADIKVSWNDFAILARTNFSLERFAEALEKNNLPYIWLSSTGLYRKPVILDSLAYLRLLDNYHESTAVWRILNLAVFKIKNETLAQITYWARRKGWSLWEVLKQAAVLRLEAGELESINKLLSLTIKHSQLAREGKLAEAFLSFWQDSGYLKFIQNQSELKAREDLSYLNQFFSQVKDFVLNQTNLAKDENNQVNLLANFLFRIKNEQEAGEAGVIELDPEKGPEAIKLMTVHKAKGLEFKYVFLVNLVEQIFPSRQRSEGIEVPLDLTKEVAKDKGDNLAEERRLFYVAITRAKVGLFLSWAKNLGGKQVRKPSRFIAESGLKTLDQPQTKDNAVINTLTPADNEIEVQSKSTYPANGLKSHSHTTLRDFRECPLKYKYAYVFKIPTLGNFNLSFGSTLHKVLQKIMQRFLVKAARQVDLFGESAESSSQASLSWPEIKAVYESEWIDDWYPSRLAMEKNKQTGLKILKEFYQKHKDHWPKVLFLEKNFRLFTADYQITGRIDRVDQLASGVKIVDYKAGSRPKVLDSDSKKQLLLYQLAAEEVFKLKVESLSYYFLTDNEEIAFLGQSKDLENLKLEIRQTIGKIKASDFKATPNKFVCQWCNFKDICEFRAV